IVTAFANTVAFTLASVYRIERVHLNPFQLVLVGTVLEASVLLFELPTGIVADRWGRRRSVLIGTTILGFAFLFEISVPSFGFVLAAQVLWGFGYTFTSGATEAWLAGEIGDDDVGRMFLHGSLVRRIAALVGIGTAILLGNANLRLPMAAAGVMTLLL